ncbi:hypothetical protein [Catellatospora tritici]|uniref:hypothetical protein n=1 Tax=Catellatospora tritici TaxID=2851566 RepID=UPI001C2D576C|nr:hypothetical protein [Catellatospora tritici]MBV1856166.1 hypothetical protein [Catellatospora tritici]
MPNLEDVHAARRAELLAPVARLCTEAGVAVSVGEFTGQRGATVRALLSSADEGCWSAVVTVVRAHRIPAEHQWGGHSWTRSPESGYDLDSAGELVYEVQVHEDDDGSGGHGTRPLVLYRLHGTAQAAADELILWDRRTGLFTTRTPVPDAARELRRQRRCFEHREAAAAAPRVTVDGTLPAQAATAVAALDPAALCWHFPREQSGRFQRNAVVALASYGNARPHLRGSWLTVRTADDCLVVSMADLIGANQRHRWDATPWLWHGRHAGTPAADRWQVRAADLVQPAFEALRRGEVPQALAMSGVRVDDQLSSLLAGRPSRAFRAELTDTWVHGLYQGLGDSAPWRLGHAYRVWRDGRTALGLPVREPVVLFGLGGLGQQRKPKVALDLVGDEPRLRLVFSGSNAVLPRALWTVPADLAARLHGWTPTPPATKD